MSGPRRGGDTLVARSLKIPSITSRLLDAQEYAGPFAFSLLVSWKLTSGISHGRRAAMLALLDREVLSTTELGVSANMTSSFATIAGLYKTTLHYLLRLLALFMGRNGTPLDV